MGLKEAERDLRGYHSVQGEIWGCSTNTSLERDRIRIWIAMLGSPAVSFMWSSNVGST